MITDLTPIVSVFLKLRGNWDTMIRNKNMLDSELQQRSVKRPIIKRMVINLLITQ